jgi:hypothetical protein
MRSMKRLLLVCVLATALLCLLAAPALAATPGADFRLSEKTAYIFSYGDGSWFEVKDVADPLSFVGHWTTYDDDGNFVAPADPIPANFDIVMQVSIKFIPRGQVQNLPKKFLISLSIPEAGVDLSYQQSKAYWNLHIWDQYWVDATDMPILAFNPHIGAQPWANTWLAPLTGDKGLATNLVDQKLPPGTYTVNYTESVVQPFTTLEIAWDDEGNPVPPTWEWTHVRPYTSDLVVFTFTVGLPV